jgi:hypothetical protein
MIVALCHDCWSGMLVTPERQSVTVQSDQLTAARHSGNTYNIGSMQAYNRQSQHIKGERIKQGGYSGAAISRALQGFRFAETSFQEISS